MGCGSSQLLDGERSPRASSPKSPKKKSKRSKKDRSPSDASGNSESFSIDDHHKGVKLDDELAAAASENNEADQKKGSSSDAPATTADAAATADPAAAPATGEPAPEAAAPAEADPAGAKKKKRVKPDGTVLSSDEEEGDLPPPPAPAPAPEDAGDEPFLAGPPQEEPNVNPPVYDEEPQEDEENIGETTEDQAFAESLCNPPPDEISQEMDPAANNIYGLPQQRLMEIWESKTVADILPAWMGAPVVVTLNQSVLDVAKIMAVEHASACLVLDPGLKAYAGFFTDQHLCSLVCRLADAQYQSRPDTAAFLLTMCNPPPLVDHVMGPRDRPMCRFDTILSTAPLYSALKLMTESRGPPTGDNPVSYAACGGDARLLVVTDKPNGEPKALLSPQMLLNFMFEYIMKLSDPGSLAAVAQKTLLDLNLSPSLSVAVEAANCSNLGTNTSVNVTKIVPNATVFKSMAAGKLLPCSADWLPSALSNTNLLTALRMMNNIPSWRLPISIADIAHDRALRDGTAVAKKTNPDVETLCAAHIKYLFAELDTSAIANDSAPPEFVRTKSGSSRPAINKSSVPLLTSSCVSFLSNVRKYLLKMKTVDGAPAADGFIPQEEDADDPASNPLGSTVSVTTDTQLRAALKSVFDYMPPLTEPPTRPEGIPPNAVSPVRYGQAWLASHFMWVKEEANVVIKDTLPGAPKGGTSTLKQPIVIGAVDLLDVLAVFNPLAKDLSLIKPRHRALIEAKHQHYQAQVALKSSSASFLSPNANRIGSMIGYNWNPNVLRAPSSRAPSSPKASLARAPSMSPSSSAAPFIPPPSIFARQKQQEALGFSAASISPFTSPTATSSPVPLDLTRKKSKSFSEALAEKQMASQKNDEDEDMTSIPVGETHF